MAQIDVDELPRELDHNGRRWTYSRRNGTRWRLSKHRPHERGDAARVGARGLVRGGLDSRRLAAPAMGPLPAGPVRRALARPVSRGDVFVAGRATLPGHATRAAGKGAAHLAAGGSRLSGLAGGRRSVRAVTPEGWARRGGRRRGALVHCWARGPFPVGAQGELYARRDRAALCLGLALMRDRPALVASLACFLRCPLVRHAPLRARLSRPYWRSRVACAQASRRIRDPLQPSGLLSEPRSPYRR